jgi:hypothetical protein
MISILNYLTPWFLWSNSVEKNMWQLKSLLLYEYLSADLVKSFPWWEKTANNGTNIFFSALCLQVTTMLFPRVKYFWIRWRQEKDNLGPIVMENVARYKHTKKISLICSY